MYSGKHILETLVYRFLNDPKRRKLFPKGGKLMKKLLFLIISLISIGSIYAMDDQNPDDSPINPYTNLNLSDASLLAAEGTPEGDYSLALLPATQNSLSDTQTDVSTSSGSTKPHMSLSQALEMMESLSKEPTIDEAELPDISGSSTIKRSKQPKQLSPLRDRVRRGLNKRGYYGISRRIYKVNNATAAVNLAAKTTDSAQKLQLITEAAQSSQKNSQGRRKALLELFKLIKKLRTTEYASLIVAQRQFKKPVGQRTFLIGSTDTDLGTLWLKNFGFFQSMHKPRKIMYSYLKEHNANGEILSILKNRNKLLGDTLKPLDSRAKKIKEAERKIKQLKSKIQKFQEHLKSIKISSSKRLSPTSQASMILAENQISISQKTITAILQSIFPTADERLFCELQDSEANSLIEAHTSIMKEEDEIAQLETEINQQDQQRLTTGQRITLKQNKTSLKRKKRNILSKKQGMILSYKLHYQLGIFVRKLHSNQEIIKAIEGALGRLDIKPRKSLKEKNRQHRYRAAHDSLIQSNELLFNGIRQAFFIQETVKPLEDKLRRLQRKQRTATREKRSATETKKTILESKITQLNKDIISIEQEIAQRESWISCITTIFTKPAGIHGNSNISIKMFNKKIKTLNGKVVDTTTLLTPRGLNRRTEEELESKRIKLRQEIKYTQEWLNFISYFVQDPQNYKTVCNVLNQFSILVNSVIQSESRIPELTAKIASHQERLELIKDPTTQNEVKEKIAGLKTQQETLIDQLKEQKLEVEAFIASKRPTATATQ